MYNAFPRINDDLSVEVLKTWEKGDKGEKDRKGEKDGNQTNVSLESVSPKTPSRAKSYKTGDTSTPVKDKLDLTLDFQDDEFANETDVTEVSILSQKQANLSNSDGARGTLKKSKKDWLSQLSANFVEIVVQGLEASMRSKVKSSIEGEKKLSPKQNKSVIAAVNHEIFKFVGNQRPDASMCR